MGKLYIIGSGLAGLSASLWASKKKLDMHIFESTGMSGGRCRSFYDKKMEIEIDNGNHIVLSANNNFYEFCQIVESVNSLKKIPPIFNFFNLEEKLYWKLDLYQNGPSSIIFNKEKGIPNSKVSDYYSLLNFLFVKKSAKVEDLINKHSTLYKNFWEPFTLGIMNTSPRHASANVLSNVLKKTLFRGKDFFFVYQPIKNWNKTLIEPAIAYLKKRKKDIMYNHSLKGIEIKDNRICKLQFNRMDINVNKNDKVILALPLNIFGKFFPSILIPSEFNTIINIHYKLSDQILKKFRSEIIGMIESKSQWIFVKKGYISITISDANKFEDIPNDIIAELVWKEVCEYLAETLKLPTFRVIKEKKATYNQSPENNHLLSNINPLPKNLLIAGDWTQNKLPCTIEGSILSGKKAVELLDF